MSQENPPNCTVPTKKFLKKGEGLKRFAAYKPPLPVSANKIKRRQTFVKFTIDHKSHKAGQTPTYLPPEILYNDSINLSTEIPKIAPPKIMHTPIRPNRQALGQLGPATFNFNTGDDSSSDSEQIYNPYRPRVYSNRTPMKPIFNQVREQNNSGESNQVLDSLPERNLTRKVVTIEANSLNKKISFSGFRKPATPSPNPPNPPVAQTDEPKRHRQVENKETEAVAPRRYNLRGSKKQNSESATETGDFKLEPKVEPKRTRRQLKAIVERHIPSASDIVTGEAAENSISDSQINGNIDELMRKIDERKRSELKDDDEELEQPATIENNDEVSEHEECGETHQKAITPGHGVKYSQAFDLSSPAPGSCILALGQQIQHIESTVNALKDSLKNCECGAFLTSTKPITTRSSRKTSRAKASEKTRPSADADNTTHKILSSLMDDVAQLKAKFDEFDIKR